MNGVMNVFICISIASRKTLAFAASATRARLRRASRVEY